MVSFLCDMERTAFVDIISTRFGEKEGASPGASLGSCPIRRRVDPARPVPIRLLVKHRKKLVSYGTENDRNRLRRVRAKIGYEVDDARCSACDDDYAIWEWFPVQSLLS